MAGINVCGNEVELRGGDRYDLMWESEVERMLKPRIVTGKQIGRAHV